MTRNHSSRTVSWVLVVRETLQVICQVFARCLPKSRNATAGSKKRLPNPSKIWFRSWFWLCFWWSRSSRARIRFFMVALPLALVWLASRLAETNRNPYDLAEGEWELISGFNIEYRSGGFALICIAEYARILFIRCLTVTLFLGPNVNFWLYTLKGALEAFTFIWARGTLPRTRYDKLIRLAWKRFLPTALNYVLMLTGLKVIFNSI